MFTFITAVRHPDTAASYERVEMLSNRTLLSVCNHTDGEFRVIVVCNQEPMTRFVDARVSYLTTEEKPLETDNLLLRTRIDKGMKFALGLAAAREFDTQYVMFLTRAISCMVESLSIVAITRQNSVGMSSAALYTRSERCLCPDLRGSMKYAERRTYLHTS